MAKRRREDDIASASAPNAMAVVQAVRAGIKLQREDPQRAFRHACLLQMRVMLAAKNPMTEPLHKFSHGQGVLWRDDSPPETPALSASSSSSDLDSGFNMVEDEFAMLVDELEDLDEVASVAAEQWASQLR